MEEAAFSFEIIIEGSGRYECRLRPESKDWAVQVEWRFTEPTVDFVIEIRRLTPAPYMEFYADLVLIVPGCKPLAVTAKGPKQLMKIPVQCAEFLGVKFKNSSELVAVNLVSKEMTCRTRLSPFLPLKRSIATNLDSINEKHVDILIDHISSLQYSREYDMFFDIVVTSGNTSVKAHKCILAARLPDFVSQISRRLPRRPEDDLEEIRIIDNAEAGLHQMISYVYSNTYSREFLSVANLVQTAEAMDSHHLKLTFLNAFMEGVTVKNVLYAIFFTFLHGEWRHWRQAMTYMLDHFEEVQATPEWNNLQVIFACFQLRRNDVHDLPNMELLKISLGLHVKMFYTLPGEQ